MEKMFKDDMVFVCGAYRKYRDMPKKQTRDYERSINELLDSYNPIVRKSEELIDKRKAVQEELDDINEWIGLLKGEKDKDLKAIESSMKKRKELRDKLRDIGKEIIEYNNSQEAKLKELDEMVPLKLAELASQMIEITPEEYYDKATETDELFMRYISVFKQMYDARQTIPEMEHRWKEILSKSIDNRIGNIPS